MNRSITMTLSAGAIVVLGCWLTEFVEIYSDSIFRVICRGAERAEREHQQREEFYPYLCTALDDLAAGRSSLRETSRQLIETARTMHPEFLKHLNVVERGKNIDLKMASYLFGYFVGDIAVRSKQVDDQRRAALAAEFAAIVDKGL